MLPSSTCGFPLFLSLPTGIVFPNETKQQGIPASGGERGRELCF